MAAKVTVRELVTKLTIGGNAGDKLAKFGLAMNGVKAGLDLMVGAVRAASAATLGLVDDVTQAGDAIAKTSREVGVTAKQFQRLSFAADRSGVPLQNLKKGLQNIERNLRDATIAAGKGQSTGFSAALAEVGIRLKEFEGLDAEEKIGLLGEALSQVADEGRRVALSQKLVGEEAGPKFASFLAEGTEGIKALGDEAERLGLVMSDDALAASESFQDSMTNMGSVLKGIKTTIGVALIPVVQKAVDKFRDWLLQNRKFITSRFEKFVEGLTKAFDFLVKNIDRIIRDFGDLAEIGGNIIRIFMNLTDAVGGVGNALRIATVAWGTYKTAALAATVGLSLGPVGLLAIALAGVAVAFTKVETAATRARRAGILFEEGTKESAPVDKKQVESDAAALVSSVRNVKRLSPEVRQRLATTSKEQATLTFLRANDIKREARRKSRKRVFNPKTGGFFPQIAGGAQGQSEEIEDQLLRDTQATINFERRQARIAQERSIESQFDTSTDDGGRTFTPIKEPGKPKKDDFADLLAGAIKSGQFPESAALLASTQPPIIIPITNIAVTVDVDATSTFEGVPGENALEFTGQAQDFLEEFWDRKMNTAMDELRPQLAR